jgi:uncharacterized membrane protein (UPF0127 family)
MTSKQNRRKRMIFATLAVALLAPLNALSAGSAEAKMPTAKIGSNQIKLEVAASEQEIQTGLMQRTSLPEDQGMVFLFHPPRPVNFWMCHTLIPLDMLFIEHGKIKKIFHDVPPCKSPDCSNCANYPEGKGMEVSEVIEVNGGYAKRHNINEGDRVDLELK